MNNVKLLYSRTKTERSAMDVDALNSGSITVTGGSATVPEPASLLLLLAGLPIVWAGKRLRRR